MPSCLPDPADRGSVSGRGSLAGCSEFTSGDTSPINLDWGPHGGAQGMGGSGRTPTRAIRPASPVRRGKSSRCFTGKSSWARAKSQPAGAAPGLSRPVPSNSPPLPAAARYYNRFENTVLVTMMACRSVAKVFFVTRQVYNGSSPNCATAPMLGRRPWRSRGHRAGRRDFRPTLPCRVGHPGLAGRPFPSRCGRTHAPGPAGHPRASPDGRVPCHGWRQGCGLDHLLPPLLALSAGGATGLHRLRLCVRHVRGTGLSQEGHRAPPDGTRHRSSALLRQHLDRAAHPCRTPEGSTSGCGFAPASELRLAL